MEQIEMFFKRVLHVDHTDRTWKICDILCTRENDEGEVLLDLVDVGCSIPVGEIIFVDDTDDLQHGLTEAHAVYRDSPRNAGDWDQFLVTMHLLI